MFAPDRLYLWKDFIKCWWNVWFSERICKIHDNTLAKAQCYNLRLGVWTFEFLPLCQVFLYNIDQILKSLRLYANRMYVSTMSTQGQGHSERSIIWTFDFMFALCLYHLRSCINVSFKLTKQKCFLQWEYVPNTCLCYADSRSVS